MVFVGFYRVFLEGFEDIPGVSKGCLKVFKGFQKTFLCNPWKSSSCVFVVVWLLFFSMLFLNVFF